MKRTYKALLHGNRVEWLDSPPPDTGGPVEVYVTISDDTDTQPLDDESKSVFDLFQELADMGAFSEIEDPVAWQREIRKDRPLPFRDNDAD